MSLHGFVVITMRFPFKITKYSNSVQFAEKWLVLSFLKNCHHVLYIPQHILKVSFNNRMWVWRAFTMKAWSTLSKPLFNSSVIWQQQQKQRAFKPLASPHNPISKKASRKILNLSSDAKTSLQHQLDRKRRKNQTHWKGLGIRNCSDPQKIFALSVYLAVLCLIFSPIKSKKVIKILLGVLFRVYSLT